MPNQETGMNTLYLLEEENIVLKRLHRCKTCDHIQLVHSLNCLMTDCKCSSFEFKEPKDAIVSDFTYDVPWEIKGFSNIKGSKNYWLDAVRYFWAEAEDSSAHGTDEMDLMIIVDWFDKRREKYYRMYKVVCVYNEGEEHNLTEGKVYDLIEEDDGAPIYKIIDDNGKEAPYYDSRFIEIEKLNPIEYYSLWLLFYMEKDKITKLLEQYPIPYKSRWANYLHIRICKAKSSGKHGFKDIINVCPELGLFK